MKLLGKFTITFQTTLKTEIYQELKVEIKKLSV